MRTLPAERLSNRKLFLLILILLGSSVAKDQDYPLTAVLGIGRGKYPGEYVTEIRIGHTVYVSEDACRKADPGLNARYPARMHDRTIWVLVGSVACKYHVSDEHPFLMHTPGPNK
jgi:hypothetical protein